MSPLLVSYIPYLLLETQPPFIDVCHHLLSMTFLYPKLRLRPKSIKFPPFAESTLSVYEAYFTVS